MATRTVDRTPGRPAGGVVRFTQEAWQELAKVTWPTQRDNNKYTILVITLSVGLGVFFFVLDWIFSKGLAGLINLAS